MQAVHLFVLAVVATAYPVPPEGDTMIVESTVREVREAVPEELADLIKDDTDKAFLHTYGDDEDNVQGYHKRSDDEGGNGYKHFDGFHKKDGDKYGYETHSSYGKSDKADGSGVGSEDNENYEEEDGDDEGEAETRNTYQVVEDVNEDEAGAGDYAEEGHKNYSDDVDEDSGNNDDGGHHHQSGSSGYAYGPDFDY